MESADLVHKDLATRFSASYSHQTHPLQNPYNILTFPRQKCARVARPPSEDQPVWNGEASLRRRLLPAWTWRQARPSQMDGLGVPTLSKSHPHLLSNRGCQLEWFFILPAWQDVYTSKSDVWSFGVALWEILTFAREQPHEAAAEEKVRNFNVWRFVSPSEKPM